MSFDDRQKNYYLHEINRAIPVASTSGLSLEGAARTVDPLLARDSIGIGVSSADLFAEMNTANAAVAKDAACRAYDFPAAGMRPAGARTGCGWWFVPDGRRQSVGAYGTARGPMTPTLDSQFGSGQWIWDPVEAQKMEGLKRAKAIRSCEDIQYSTIPNVGWCTSTGMAVMTDGRGNPAFPSAAGGDCPDGRIVTSASNCPRLDETDSGQGAGSWAWEGGGGSITSLCKPTAAGTLTPACLQSLTNQVCSSAGLLSGALGRGYADETPEVKAIHDYMSQRQFTMPTGIFREGTITTDQALTGMRALRNKANSGDGSRVAAASAALCYGTLFDPCVINPAETGPFSMECIRQAAAQIGYAAKSELLNNAAYWGKFRTWQEVIDELTYWKQTADTTKTSKVQLDAVNKVYGVKVRPPRQGCNLSGVFLTRYFYPSPNEALYVEPSLLTPTTGAPSNTHFLGRYLLKNGFDASPAIRESEPTPAGSFLTEFQRMETIFTPTVPGRYQFAVSGGVSDSIKIWIDGKLYGVYGPQNNGGLALLPVIEGWGIGESHQVTIDFRASIPWRFDIKMSVNGGAWQNIPADQLTFPVDRRVPMLDMDFMKLKGYTKGGIVDANGLFRNLYIQPATLGNNGGVYSFTVNGSCIYNFLEYAQGIRARACKSLTMMVNVAEVGVAAQNGQLPTLFGFYNTSRANPNGPPRKGGPEEGWDYGSRQQDMGLYISGGGAIQFAVKNQADPQKRPLVELSAPTPIQFGVWNHIAIVWDDDWNGYTLYVNGAAAKRERLQGPPTTLIYEQIRVGSDYPNAVALNMEHWKGAIAWFRGFDYRLNQEMITTDRQNGWAKFAEV